MPVVGEYVPSPHSAAARQVEEFEASGGARANTMQGYPIVVLSTVGARTGALRKIPLMRVEHEGVYAVVASMGGAPQHPVWYYNLRANPLAELQDGPNRWDVVAREVSGAERDVWWERAVAAFPPYGDYERRTDRLIPVFVLEPAH